MIEHLDDAGNPCTRHPAVAGHLLLSFALVGSRAATFHHDCASKLQSIVLALDEIGELAAGNAAILQAVEGATASLGSLNALLDLNRALTKPPPRTKVGLARLLEDAAARVRVTLRGALPVREVAVAAPMVTHALSLLIDLGAGVEDYKRIADVTSTSTGVTIVDRGVTTEPDAHVLVGLAAYFLARDGGELRCSRDGFNLRL